MKNNVTKIIMVKRKYNHAKAKSVTCSWHMSGGVFNIPCHKMQFKEAQVKETENLNRYYGMGDKRNWG